MSNSEYIPPKVWTWEAPSGGQFASINRPIAGPTHDKDLPVGKHPLQLLFARYAERPEGRDHARGIACARPFGRRI